MNLAETIYQKSLSLSPAKAQEVIDFIDFLMTCPPVESQPIHENEANTIPQPTFSERWRGKFARPDLSPEALATDPKLAYLAEKYQL